MAFWGAGSSAESTRLPSINLPRVSVIADYHILICLPTNDPRESVIFFFFLLIFFFSSLFTVLVVYFLLACWVAGTAISSGLVVPML